MRSRRVIMWVLAIAIAATPAVALAKSAEDAYLSGYNSMGKSTAAWVASQTGLIKAENSVLAALVSAQNALVNAQVTVGKAAAEINSTNVKTMQAVQAVRSAAMDNSKKAAANFYEMRKLYDADRALHVRKRPSQEDLNRYAKVAAPDGPEKYQLASKEGGIRWPAVFMQDEFLEYRMQLDSLLAKSKDPDLQARGSTNRQARHVVAKMRNAGSANCLLTERGASFGYNNLVSDMRAIPRMQALGCPVVYDATHSTQLPGGQGACSGGQREMAATLALAAVAAGCDALVLEAHEEPEHALCDAATMLPVDALPDLLRRAQAVREAVR